MSELVDGSAQDIVNTKKQIDLNTDLATGYVVGLAKDGSFIFEILGATPGLAELIGVHKHAAKQIDILYASKHATLDAMAVKMLSELSQEVKELRKQVQALTSQTKIDNKL